MAHVDSHGSEIDILSIFNIKVGRRREFGTPIAHCDYARQLTRLICKADFWRSLEKVQQTTLSPETLILMDLDPSLSLTAEGLWSDEESSQNAHSDLEQESPSAAAPKKRVNKSLPQTSLLYSTDFRDI